MINQEDRKSSKGLFLHVFMYLGCFGGLLGLPICSITFGLTMFTIIGIPISVICLSIYFCIWVFLFVSLVAYMVVVLIVFSKLKVSDLTPSEYIERIQRTAPDGGRMKIKCWHHEFRTEEGGSSPDSRKMVTFKRSYPFVILEVKDTTQLPVRVPDEFLPGIKLSCLTSVDYSEDALSYIKDAKRAFETANENRDEFVEVKYKLPKKKKEIPGVKKELYFEFNNSLLGRAISGGPFGSIVGFILFVTGTYGIFRSYYLHNVLHFEMTFSKLIEDGKFDELMDIQEEEKQLLVSEKKKEEEELVYVLQEKYEEEEEEVDIEHDEFSEEQEIMEKNPKSDDKGEDKLNEDDIVYGGGNERNIIFRADIV